MAINPVVLATVAGTQVNAKEDGTPFWDSSGDGFDGYEGPDYATNSWDLAILNGLKVPGITKVKCIGKKKIHTPKATGRDGGPTTDQGHEAARLEITINVWTPSQWRIWQAVAKKIWRAPGTPIVRPEGAVKDAPEIKAVTIVHPSCSTPPLSVSALLIETFESAEWTADKGAIIRIKAVQYIVPKNASVTSKVAGAAVPLAPEFQGSAGVAPPKPSTTDAVPVLLRRPG